MVHPRSFHFIYNCFSYALITYESVEAANKAADDMTNTVLGAMTFCILLWLTLTQMAQRLVPTFPISVFVPSLRISMLPLTFCIDADAEGGEEEEV